MSYFETKRLLIRTWAESDEAALFAILGDVETMRFVGNCARTRERSAAFLAQMIERQNAELPAFWPVVRKADGTIIGMCGLLPLDGGPELHIGWHFARAAWGEGYAFEAATAVVVYALQTLRMPRLVCVIHPENKRSIVLANRLGVRFECIERHYGMDLLKYQVIGGVSSAPPQDTRVMGHDGDTAEEVSGA